MPSKLQVSPKLLRFHRQATDDNDKYDTIKSEYKDIFKFGDYNLMIPFEKLDDIKAI